MSSRGGNPLLSALVLCLWLVHTGCMSDNKPKISIEFGAYPDQFEGLEVEIDGKVVGKLERHAAITRSAFPVTKGEHLVRIRSDKYACAPRKVKIERNLEKQMLILNISESSGIDGKLALELQ